MEEQKKEELGKGKGFFWSFFFFKVFLLSLPSEKGGA